MRIVCVDHSDDGDFSETLICSDVSKIEGEVMVEALNEAFTYGIGSQFSYSLVTEDYILHEDTTNET